MITEEMVFSKDAINIFTDASILKMSHGKFLGCPGFAVVNQDTVLEYGWQILGDTTSAKANTVIAKLTFTLKNSVAKDATGTIKLNNRTI